MATTRNTAGTRPSVVAVALLVLALIAAACGVPDDIETTSDEPTLETLTPVAPAAEPAEEGEAEPTPETLPPVTTTDEPTPETVPTDDDDDDDEDVIDGEAEDAAPIEKAAPADEAEETAPTDEAEDAAAEVATEDPEEATTTTAAPTTTEAQTTTTTTEAVTTTTAAPTTTNAVAASARILSQISLDLELVASLSRPVAFATRPGTSDVFIGEQGGRIVRLPDGAAGGADTTLDIRGGVSGGNEQGLLGLPSPPTADGSM